ncbi:MAG: noncanonical pyrimidine nucleotidase, YjjG family [Pedobacter sp.]|nr:MAG: noncanonical pyrimidine nucleotidase, YjjG family [Pedobacter sp.]
MIKHIFFDLDHTLWDFDKNAQETLLELYVKYKLDSLGVKSSLEFIERYTENNHLLWAQYHRGEITKNKLREQRFRKTFLELGMDPDYIPHEFEDEYVRLSPTKTNLFENTLSTLTYLSKSYHLHIISNGFKEPTLTKMQVSDLNPYFKNIIISEDVGVNKPHPDIFKYALDKAEATLPESIMIGDSIEADIRGAQSFGLKAIYFNPQMIPVPHDVNWQIHNLNELLNHF